MLSKCVLKSYLILPFSGKIPILSYFLVEIFLLFDENSYFFDLSYYLTPCQVDKVAC